MTTGIFGSAAAGLGVDAHYVASEGARTAGAAGERATAAILDSFATRAAVLHDLKVPGQKRINIDHAIVTGNRVVLIDAKTWKAGFYWSAAGRNFRDVLHPVHTSEAVAIAHTRWAAHLTRLGLKATLPTPLVAVWSGPQAAAASRSITRSSTVPAITGASPSVWALHYPGAKAIAATALARRVEKLIVNAEPDAQIVAAMRTHLTHQPVTWH